MTTSLASPPQIQSQYCFLSPLDVHESLVAELNNTVLLYSTQQEAAISRHQLRHNLRARYGGTHQDWKIKVVSRGFLILIPNWLYHDELHLDSHFWSRYNLVVQPWQALDRSHVLPAMHRVRLTIVDFPIDYWHPFYIRQATSSMGLVSGIHRDCVEGEDRVTIRAWLDTPDLNLIRHYLYLGLCGLWTECRVFVEGRPPLLHATSPAAAKPSSPGSRNI